MCFSEHWGGLKMMDQRRPLRVLIVGLDDHFGRVVTTNIQCWGYEVMVQPASLQPGGDQEARDQLPAFEGDILLYDLDTSFRPLMIGKDSPVVQRGLLASDFLCGAEWQWPDARLTIALSSRSVSRTMLEQIGAVALLQKPFEMGRLQRYLRVLQRLVRPDRSKETLPCSPASEQLRILVVDDDMDVAHAIQQCLLYESGYEVAVAYDGLEALEHCLDWQPQCIVTDLIMPWMNGYQVMRCLSVGVRRSMPAVVVMSALTQLERPVNRSYLEGRAVTYVDKPFRIERLLSAIKQVCAG
jgi:CheY-like chemotaxis protein